MGSDNLNNVRAIKETHLNLIENRFFVWFWCPIIWTNSVCLPYVLFIFHYNQFATVLADGRYFSVVKKFTVRLSKGISNKKLLTDGEMIHIIYIYTVKR